jgi:flagellar motility protein MotE (MotC chaperone)
MSPLPKLPRPLLRQAAAAALTGALLASPALALDNKAKQTPPPDRPSTNEIARYCAVLAPKASEVRAAHQLRRLADLEREVQTELGRLDAKETAAREWVTKRESMLNQATTDVVAIYAKMAPDAAAAALAAMDEGEAAAVLTKLKPQAAGAILAEMQAEKAARLSSLISGRAGLAKS